MARTVTVAMEIDDQGVMRTMAGLGGEAISASEALDRMDATLEEVEGAAADLSPRMEGVGRAMVSVDSSSERAQQGLQEVEGQAIDTADRMERAAQQSRGFSSTLNDDLNPAMGNASQVIFSTGDAIQDMQFGLAGAANNLAFTAEAFAEMQQQAGGTRAAFSGIWTALKGPAGVILGLQALLALGPQVVQFFSDTEEGASDLSDTMDSVASDLVTLESRFEGVTATVPADELTTYRDRLEEAQSEQEILVRALERIDALGGGTFAQLQESLQQVWSQITGGAPDETVIGRALEGAEEAADALGLSVETIKAGLTGVDPSAVERVTDALNENPGALEEARRRQKAINQLLDDARTAVQRQQIAQEQLNAARQAGAEAFPEAMDIERIQQEAEALGPVALGVQLDLQNLELADPNVVPTAIQEARTAIEQGLNQSINSVNGELARLQGALQRATGPTERKRIKKMIRQLRRLKQEMTGVKKETEKTGGTMEELEQVGKQALEQSLTRGFVQLGKAIGQGEDLMTAFGDAAKKILADLMMMIGKQLVAMGTAELLANPGKGAAMIAAGTTLITAGAATSSTIGGDGGGGGQQGTAPRGEEPATGGQINTGVDAPGRRQGGPVQGGRLYRTHGMGQREFFMPATDGMVVTSDAMRAAAGRSGAQHRVRTEHSLDVSVEDPDLFTLRERLNELESDIEQLT